MRLRLLQRHHRRGNHGHRHKDDDQKENEGYRLEELRNKDGLGTVISGHKKMFPEMSPRLIFAEEERRQIITYPDLYLTLQHCQNKS